MLRQIHALPKIYVTYSKFFSPQFIRKNRPKVVSYEEALKQVKEEERYWQYSSKNKTNGNLITFPTFLFGRVSPHPPPPGRKARVSFYSIFLFFASWLVQKNPRQHCQPIRFKVNTNCNMVTRVSSRLRHFVCLNFELLLSPLNIFLSFDQSLWSLWFLFATFNRKMLSIIPRNM